MGSLKISKSKEFKEFFDVVSESRKIDFLVLHHVEATSASHAVEQFIEHGVSAHFLIDESGSIFQLVDENNIAYHAGVSFWKGMDGLNKCSIGIEFINSDPFGKNFEDVQMQSGVKLCEYLVKKYNINPQNVVAHSDIGYDKESGFLDRKQDPSHFFDWRSFAKRGVGVYPNICLLQREHEVLFKFKDEDSEILKIKKSLANFGYKVTNLDSCFDEEMRCLVRVFNRRFNQNGFKVNSDVWSLGSQRILDNIR